VDFDKKRQMSRRSPLALLTLIALFATGTASATTYYIAANGSDSNNGTSKTSPWQHAPGMPSCTGVCASTTPGAGDQFVFRGGDTWHYGAGTPAVGGTWNWNWSGSSGNVIYIGVDNTWFAGSAWARPIMTGDNSATRNFITSCSHNTPSMFSFGTQSYVTIDNFEWTGKCWSSGDGPTTIDFYTGNHNTVSNGYFHGWMTCNTCNDDGYEIAGYAYHPGANPMSTITGNVFDGSDTHCNGANDCEGYLTFGDTSIVTNNVFQYVDNVLNADDILVFAGNLVVNAYESFNPATHSNIAQWQGYNPSAVVPIYVYNNIVANLATGETFDVAVTTQGYWFNNVFFNNGNPSNCFMEETGKTGETGVHDYWYNNTIVNPCSIRYVGAGNARLWNGTSTFQNNHIVAYSPQSLSSLYVCYDAGAVCNVVDNGSEVYQSLTTANSQGYTAAGNFAPTSSSGATVGAGINASNFCNTIPDSAAAAACKNGNATVTYDSVRHVAVVPTPVPRPSSGAWDSGAYQFGSISALNPPSGLTATIQ
jgi:hypothetical protein